MVSASANLLGVVGNGGGTGASGMVAGAVLLSHSRFVHMVSSTSYAALIGFISFSGP